MERQILFAPEAAPHDETPEAKCGAIKHAILTALASDPHTIALRRVLVDGDCVSDVARDSGRKASWFSMSVLPGFKRRLRFSLKDAGIAVSVKGRSDARVMRRLYAAMMAPSPTADVGSRNTRL